MQNIQSRITQYLISWAHFQALKKGLKILIVSKLSLMAASEKTGLLFLAVSNGEAA